MGHEKEQKTKGKINDFYHSHCTTWNKQMKGQIGTNK
jgi:hypothetical protein